VKKESDKDSIEFHEELLDNEDELLDFIDSITEEE